MSAPDTPRGRVTVVGIGNPIMGDDGVGIAILEELMRGGVDGPVEYVDGGTIGMNLLPVVADAESLLIFDAVAGRDAPGTLVVLEGDQLPRFLNSKLSPHQVGLVDVLACVRLLGTEPARVTVVGVVPEDVEMRVGLTAAVAAAVAPATERARQVLAAWWADDEARAGLGADGSTW